MSDRGPSAVVVQFSVPPHRRAKHGRPVGPSGAGLAGADADEEDRRKLLVSLAGAALVAALVLAGWFLVRELAQSARIQDCVMSGRTNCVPIGTSQP